MSIKQRVEEAVILDDIGRKDGALLSALVAFAATSRARYPSGSRSNWDRNKKMGDREAFRLFFKDETESIYGKGLRLNLPAPCPDPKIPGAPTTSMAHGDILYKYVRCELVHEARLPHTIEFRKEADGGIYAGYEALNNRFVFSESWLCSVIRAVLFASENDVVFDNERATGEIVVRQHMPFAFSRQNINDFVMALGEKSQQVNADSEAIFSFRY